MRKIQKPLLILVFALLAITSCKRETLRDKPNSSNEAGRLPGNSNVIYKKSAAEIAAEKSEWLKSLHSLPDNNIAARGGCGSHVAKKMSLVSITGSCPGTSWDIEYIIWSFDMVGSGYATTPVSASFTDLFSNSISATLTSSSATLVDPGCTNWWVDGYCYMVREYHYFLDNVQTPSAPWPADIGDFTLNLLSGFVPTCTPLAVTGDLKGSLTPAEISALPASITIGSGPNLQVFTECALVCPPPNAICPTSGIFSYRPQGSSGAYTNLTLNAAGGVFFGISPGTYEFTCTLSYNSGAYTSLPLTGTFTL